MAKLTVLIGLSICLLTCQNQEPTFFDLAIEDVTDIETIQLDYQRDTVVLVRKQENWLVQGVGKAREDAVDNLIKTVSGITLKYIPPKSAKNTMLEALHQNAIHVQLFDRNRNKLQDYLIGGSTPDERGTFALRTGSNQPIVVHLDYWEGNIASRYWMQPAEWLDRTILEFPETAITEVKMEYLQQADHSFTLFQIGETWKLTARGKEWPNQDVSTEAIRQYLGYFEYVGSEKIISRQEVLPLIKNVQPFAQLRIKTNEYTIEYIFYPQDWVNVLDSSPTQKIGRYFVLNSEGRAWVAQHRLFANIFRSNEYFLLNRD